MLATLTQTQYTGNVARNRKENNFGYSIKAIVKTPEGYKEPVDCRIYTTRAMAYCCIWIHSTAVHIAAGGKAGGYGYHRPSAALQDALKDGGIILGEDINGRGDQAMKDAVKAIAEALGYSDVHISHNFA